MACRRCHEASRFLLLVVTFFTVFQPTLMNRSNVMSWKQTSMLSKRGAGAECAFSDKAAFGSQPDGYRGFYFLSSFRDLDRVDATQTENSAMFPYFEFAFIRYSLYPLTRTHACKRPEHADSRRMQPPQWIHSGEADSQGKRTPNGNSLPEEADSSGKQSP